VTVEVDQVATVAGLVTSHGEYSRFVGNSATASQHIVVPPHIFIVSVSNRVNVDHLAYVNSPRILDVASLGRAGQFILAKNATTYVTVASVANIKQMVVGRNSTHTVIVSQTASVRGTFVLRGLTFTVIVGNTANVAHKFNNEYNFDIISSANVSQHINSSRVVTVIMADHLTPSDTYTFNREIERNFSDTLTLTESYSTYGIEFNRELEDFLTQKDHFTAVLIVRNPETHPRATGVEVINPAHTVLTGHGGGTITLPAAELGDSYGAKVQTNIKRSMTGKTYTYVRKSDDDVFTMTWKLSLIQAYDLRNILVASFNQYIDILTWNGQRWNARVISTNLPLTHDARWQGNDQEQLTVVVQFQGTRSL
jgi:hypothetical protein